MPANDNLGPGPGPIILSPAGYVVRIPENAYVPGSGTYGGSVVVPVLAGGASITAGTGDHPVTMAGTSGTIDCQITTGAPGAARAVVYLVDNAAAPTARLGISLDASNRPYAVLQNINGTLVAQSAPIGPTLPAGTSLHVTLTWDCRHAFNGADFVLISINGVVPNLWLYESKAPWVPFVPASLLVGYGLGADFNGTIGLVQVTNAGNEFVSSTVIPPHQDVVPIQANSSVAASLKLNQALASHPVSTALVSGAMDLHPFTPASLGAALFAWHRGDTVTLDGSNNIAAMTDKGSNGYNAAQASVPNRPGYQANGGLGYMVLTGTESLVVSGSPGMAQPFEVFIVARSAGIPGGNVFLLDTGFGSSTFITQQNTTGFIVMNAGSALDDVNLGTADHIINTQFNGVTSHVGLDGAAGTTGDAGANAFGASITIGNAVGSFLDGFIGRIYEIIVIVGLLSAANRANVIGYCKTRYTIP